MIHIEFLFIHNVLCGDGDMKTWRYLWNKVIFFWNKKKIKLIFLMWRFRSLIINTINHFQSGIHPRKKSYCEWEKMMIQVSGLSAVGSTSIELSCAMKASVVRCLYVGEKKGRFYVSRRLCTAQPGWIVYQSPYTNILYLHPCVTTKPTRHNIISAMRRLENTRQKSLTQLVSWPLLFHSQKKKYFLRSGQSGGPNKIQKGSSQSSRHSRLWVHPNQINICQAHPRFTKVAYAAM